MTRTPTHRRRRTAGHGLLLAAVPTALWCAVLVGAGLLVGGPLFRPVADAEDDLVAGLVAGRTPWWDGVSEVVSWLGNTGSVVVTALVLGLALRWLLGGWLDAVVLWAGVALQSATFLFATLLVSRERPGVDQLDPAPPTSSFPSGHTGATAALYLGLAAIIISRVERPWLRRLVVALLALVPLAMGAVRLYRGMHHPTDVLFGVLNGVVAVSVVRFATYRGRTSEAR